MAWGNVKVVVAVKKSPRNSAGQAPYHLNKSLSRSIAGGSRIFAAIRNYLRRKIFLLLNDS